MSRNARTKDRSRPGGRERRSRSWATNRLTSRVGAAVTILATAGCGTPVRPPQPTYPAAAIVTYGGREVAGATVMLAPRGQGYASQGVTDSRGRARLSTFRPGDGAAAGDYDVAVLKYDTQVDPAIEMPDPSDQEAYEAACTRLIAEGRNIYIHTPLLPERYADPAGSGLKAVVSPDGQNVFPFDLGP